jgi:hypothetical protein
MPRPNYENIAFTAIFTGNTKKNAVVIFNKMV